MNVSRLTVLLMLCLAVGIVFIPVYSAQSAPAAPIAPVTVATPTPATQNVIAGNPATINDAGASGGSGNYIYQWLEEAPAGSFTNAQDCAAPTTTTCDFVTTSGTQIGQYQFELQATDQINASNIATSAPASVNVTSAPTTTTSTTTSTTTTTTTTTGATTTIKAQLAVAAPTPASQSELQGSTVTISDTGATGGSGNYIYQWLEEPQGGSFTNAQDCAAPTTTTCAFTIPSGGSSNYLLKLQATDGTSNTATSNTASVAVVGSISLTVEPSQSIL